MALTLAAAIGWEPGAARAQPVPPALPGKAPTFKVEAVGFKCLDETGYDWAGSDEIRVGFTTASESEITSREFGDVDSDSDETHAFPRTESCIQPIGEANDRQLGRLIGARSSWSCASAGVPGPLLIGVIMAEQDFALFGFENPPTTLGPADDLIDQKILSFTVADLVARLPAVGSTVEENVLLGPCVAPRVCPDRFFFEPSPAEYRLTLRLTRMPDLIPPIDPNP